MVGDLFLHLLLLLLPLLPRSLQPPKAFDHPLHRPKSSHLDDQPFSHQHKHKYGVSLIPALPKELVVNPKLEEFNHPEHSDSLHHRDHATHDIIRTHSSETLPGFPPEVAKGKKFYNLRFLLCSGGDEGLLESRWPSRVVKVSETQ